MKGVKFVLNMEHVILAKISIIKMELYACNVILVNVPHVLVRLGIASHNALI